MSLYRFDTNSYFLCLCFYDYKFDLIFKGYMKSKSPIHIALFYGINFSILLTFAVKIASAPGMPNFVRRVG